VQPQNTALLAKTLFNLYLSQGASAKERQLFLRELAASITPVRDDEKPFNARISALVKHLTGIHYAARWEAHQDGPQVIFINCPYQEIVGDCPELCEMDRCLLEDYLGAPVTTLQTYNEPDKSIRRCRFAVRKVF
jgi:predicted ArsR family transcriptional regulator